MACSLISENVTFDVCPKYSLDMNTAVQMNYNYTRYYFVSQYTNNTIYSKPFLHSGEDMTKGASRPYKLGEKLDR